MSSDFIHTANRDPEVEHPQPATYEELKTAHYTGLGDKATDDRIAKLLSGIAKDIAALHLPKLKGVYLGGGYGRGEGGSPLYNDLDFFVLADDASESEKSDIAVALDVIAMTYSPQFCEGFHVDFCRAKNPKDFRKDEDRIMIQEFVRGFVPVYGKGEWLNFLRLRRPEELPFSEATRFLVNRGMGLLLARTRQDAEFCKRNINKAILGAGDALLVAEGRYDWAIRAREKALNDPDYSQAVAYKLHPVGDVADWDVAARLWLSAFEKIRDGHRHDLRRRTLRQALRWVKRRRCLGEISTFGMDPLTRILLPLEQLLREGRHGRPVPAELMRDWEVFN